MNMRKPSILLVLSTFMCCITVDASKRKERRAMYASSHAMSNDCADQVRHMNAYRMRHASRGQKMAENREMQEGEYDNREESFVAPVQTQSTSPKPMDEMNHEMQNKIMENKRPRNYACNELCTYQDHQIAALELSQQAREMQKKALEFQRQALQHRRQINEALEQIKQAKELADIHKEAELKMQQEALHFIKLSKNIEKQSVEHLESMAISHSQA